MDAESPEDEWQNRHMNAVYQFGLAIAELHKTNPWPERSSLDAAMVNLATEFWDHCFSQTEIRRAFEAALADLPRYAAGEERRT